MSLEEFKNKFNHRFFSPFVKNNTNFIDELDNPVRDWAHLFVKEKQHRNRISKNKNAIETHIIELPIIENKGKWLELNSEKIKKAKNHSQNLGKILKYIQELKTKIIRNNYALDVYEQVAKLTKFSYDAFLTLESFDKEEVSIKEVLKLNQKFFDVRAEFEDVYSKTRNINKHINYILDQDGHNHTANQSLNMDWQFIAELKLFEKIELTYEKN